MNRWQNLLALAAAVAIGLLNTTGIPALMGLSVLAPVLSGGQSTRLRASACAAAYYGACTWPALVILHNFSNSVTAIIVGTFVCVASGCTLAVPFCALWSQDPRKTAWMMPVAILLISVPPLGIIGVGNPVIVSGLLFPRTQWIGLLLALVLPSLLLVRPKLTVVGALLASAFLHSRPVVSFRAPSGWVGVHSTNECSSGSIECTFQSFAEVQRRSESLSGGVLVFPEGAVSIWNEASELFWESTNNLLRRRNAVVLIGATVSEGGLARNVVLVRGAEVKTFVQRVPVPLAMWQPLASRNFPLNLEGEGTMTIKGQRVAVLICTSLNLI